MDNRKFDVLEKIDEFANRAIALNRGIFGEDAYIVGLSEFASSVQVTKEFLAVELTRSTPEYVLAGNLSAQAIKHARIRTSLERVVEIGADTLTEDQKIETLTGYVTASMMATFLSLLIKALTPAPLSLQILFPFGTDYLFVDRLLDQIKREGGKYLNSNLAAAVLATESWRKPIYDREETFTFFAEMIDYSLGVNASFKTTYTGTSKLKINDLKGRYQLLISSLGKP